MDAVNGTDLPVEGHVVGWQEWTDGYPRDYDSVGEQPIGAVSAGLEAHAYSEFGDWNLVQGCTSCKGYCPTFVVGLEHHSATAEAYRGACRLETGYDFVGCEWGGGFADRVVEHFTHALFE